MVTWQEQQDVQQALTTGNPMALHTATIRLLQEVTAANLLEPEPIQEEPTGLVQLVVPASWEDRLSRLEEVIRQALGGK